jgi:hypothetical protein
MDIAEDIRLPTSVGVETLELEMADCERGDDLVVTLLIPIPGLPLQEHKDTPHLFPKQRDLFIPPGFSRISF